MKRHILFALVGGIILFVWQFISFAGANLHALSMEYTPLQDEILADLQARGLEEGMYVLGMPSPDLGPEAHTAEIVRRVGQPWAVLNYHGSLSNNMGMNMFRGLATGIAIAWLFFWLILQQKSTDLKHRIILSLCVGLISFLVVPYTNFIWYQNPDIMAHLMDGVAPWLVLGWLGHRMA